MKLALLGITGRTGHRIASLALARGHQVRALAREPARVDIAHPALEVVAGDARDAAAVARLVAGSDAVLAALGPRRGSWVVSAHATRNILAAMQQHGVRTYVGLSGAAIRLPDEPSRLRWRILLGLASVLAPAILRDKRDELRRLQASDVDWVLVRPPRLTEGPGTGQPHASTTMSPIMRIARDDLALFMLDQAERPTFARSAPFVSASRV